MRGRLSVTRSARKGFLDNSRALLSTVLAIAATVVYSGVAKAQVVGADVPPPVRSTIDVNGVDLASAR